MAQPSGGSDLLETARDARSPRVYRNERHAEMMQASFEQRDKGKVVYSLLRVDLRRTTGLTLHTDPELEAVAVYTTEPIPPAFISVVQDKIKA